MIYTLANTTTRTRNKVYRYRYQENPTQLSLVPITVFTQGQGVKIDGIGTLKKNIQPKQQIDWGKTIKHHICGQETCLKEYFSKEQIILLSDGTVSETGGFAAWIITTPNAYGNNCYIAGYGKIFETNIDSHRTECFGILGAILTYQEYTTRWQSQYSPIQIVCDNKSALNYAGNVLRYPKINSKMPDFDVLSCIRQLLETTQFFVEHVKGHQDKSPRPWNILTTINIHVDQLASEAYEYWEDDNSSSYDYLTGETWQLYAGSQKLYKNIDSAIRDYITEQQLPTVWHKYKRVQSDWFEEVDWKAQFNAMKAASTMTRLWILKRCARDCGAHAILKWRNERDDDHCPFCMQEETITHVYKCQHNKVQEVWKQSMKELEQYLQELQTAPHIIGQMLDGLDTWRNQSTTAPPPMVIDQNSIGWEGFLEGIIGKHWSEEQQFYRTTNNLATSGTKWARLIIRKLWKIAWDLWSNRNNEAHKNDDQNLMTQLLQQVQHEFDLGIQGHQELQPYFTVQAKDSVLKGNTQYIQGWLRNISARRQRLLRKQEDSADIQQMRQTLRQFLITA